MSNALSVSNISVVFVTNMSNASSVSSTSVMSAVNNTTISFRSVPAGCILKQVSQSVPWNNPENLVSRQVEVTINILFTGIALPVLFLLSFSTNVMNMVVFYKQGLKERINMCLFTLSLLDCLYVTVAYGYSSDVLYMFIIGKGDDLGPAGQFFIRTHLVGLHGLVSSSQVVSTAIALERCLCVTLPLLVKTLMPTKITAVVLWTLVLVVLAGVFVVAGLRFGLICIFDSEDQSTAFAMYPNEFYLQNKYVFDFTYGIVFGLIVPGICILCVTICTVITITRLKKLSQWRETVSYASHSLSSRDLAVTRMIVGTSILFIVCYVPDLIISTSYLVVPELTLGGRYHNLYMICIRCFQLASTINCSFNFFIYYVFGSKFRETVHQLFSCCVCCTVKKDTGH